MDVFLARQPIMNRRIEVSAYELLFRDSPQNWIESLYPDRATSQVLTMSTALLDLKTLTAGKRAFINFPRAMLLGDYITLLPKELAVVELLEDVEPDEQVLAACRRLKEDGYTLALDDFVYSDRALPLVGLADIIKLDIRTTSSEEQAELIKRFRGQGVRFLAEKVETWEEFRQSLDLGYDYFQGYFFSKPEIVTDQDIPGHKLISLRVLKEIFSRRMDFKRLESLIRYDVSIAYKLLRHVNSAFYGLRERVESIHHCLVLLGEEKIKKLASLIILSGLGKESPRELLVQASIRAHFMAGLSKLVGKTARNEEMFLLGLFLNIDAILNKPMTDVLERMPVSEDMKTALLRQDGPLSDYARLSRAQEQGDWDVVEKLSLACGVEAQAVSQLYLEAVDKVVRSMQSLIEEK